MNERELFVQALDIEDADELIASLDKSTEILYRAERAGMEVSKPKFELKGAIDALTHARVLIHSSSTVEVDKVIGPGLEVAAKGYEAGTAALAERRFRREGSRRGLHRDAR